MNIFARFRLTQVAQLCCLALLLAGCATPAAFGSDDLAEAEARWAAHGPASYQFQFQQNCFCPLLQPLLIQVRDGVPFQVTNRDDGSVVPLATIEGKATVPQLFALIHDARARKPARLETSFDPTLGYPTRIVIDYSQDIADDEFTYMIGALTALPANTPAPSASATTAPAPSATPLPPTQGAAVAPGTPFTLARGAGIALPEPDAQLRFERVLDDSRCPASVSCVWSGEAHIVLVATRSGKDLPPLELSTLSAQQKDRAAYAGYTILLQKLEPYPATPDSLGPDTPYVATLVVVPTPG